MDDHTFGPWDMCMVGDAAHITEQHHTRPDSGYTLAVVEAFDRETTERYARLIAAAPETAAERDRLKEINAELMHFAKMALEHALQTLGEKSCQGYDRAIWEVVEKEANAVLAKAGSAS